MRYILIMCTMLMMAYSATKPVAQSQKIEWESKKLSFDFKIKLAKQKKIYLVVNDGGDAIHYDHAVWMAAKFTTVKGDVLLRNLKPEKAESGWMVPIWDKTMNDAPLVVRGKVVKGLSTHAHSIIIYNIPAGATEFSATFSVPDLVINDENSEVSVQAAIYLEDPTKISLDKKPANITEEEWAEGWKPLFDGKTTTGWRNFKSQGVRKGWNVENGTLHHTKGGGDIVTEEEFGDFELKLEWKISNTGNSGIFLRSSEKYKTPWLTGIEMQILDNYSNHYNVKNPKTVAGSAYDLFAVKKEIAKKNEWNKVHIIVIGDHYQFFLNGIKTADFYTESKKFKDLIKTTKFSKFPYFAKYQRGHIVLQDHGDEVWYRNIKVRSLDKQELFNGTDISNWNHYLQGNKKRESTWSINDGILHCTGSPAGYLFTKKPYKNYKLEVQWRWVPGKNSGNNGVLVHMTPNTKVIGLWPKSMEVQMHAGNAGDFWVIGTDILTHEMKKRRSGRRILNMTDNSEKKHGLWNTMTIYCKGNEVTVYVNDDLVNHGKNMTVSKGHVCLQSEGAPIQYKKAVLTPLVK